MPMDHMRNLESGSPYRHYSLKFSVDLVFALVCSTSFDDASCVLKDSIPLALSDIEGLTITWVDEAVNIEFEALGYARREVARFVHATN